MTDALHRFRIDGPHGRLDFRAGRHPSESLPYFLCRVLAFAIHFRPELRFSRGVCVGEEPAILSVAAATGRMPLWIDIGVPGRKKLSQGLRTADRVILYTHRPPARLATLSLLPGAERIEAYRLDPAFLTAVAATALLPASRWRLALAGDRLTLNGLVTDRRLLPPQSAEANTKLIQP